MPELPEMQALAERLALFTEGRALEKVDLLGFSSLKTFAPPVEELYGQEAAVDHPPGQVSGVDLLGGARIVMHLSQAGRVDTELPAKKTRPRGSVARFVFSGLGSRRSRGGRSWSASTGHSARRRGGFWPRATKGRWRA